MDGKSKCEDIDDFFKTEPCWVDYEPKVAVDKMRDIYRETEVGGGNISGTFLKINGTKFENPMVELAKESNLEHGSFYFKGIEGVNEFELQDMFIMPSRKTDREKVKTLLTK